MRCYQIETGRLVGKYQDYILDSKNKTIFCCPNYCVCNKWQLLLGLEVKWLDEIELRRHMALDVNEINVESNTNNNQYRIVSAPKHKSWKCGP